MICSKRTQAAFQYTTVTSEAEWTRARKALEHLDLADHNATLFNRYKKDYHSELDEDFQVLWIATSGKGFPVDDCRVVCDWFNSDDRSMFFHLSMLEREPDWIGRNVFLEYVLQKLTWDEEYLDSAENAVRFLRLAQFCGFNLWNESLMEDDCCISDFVFARIYPSILKGLFQAREDHPLMARRLMDMFYLHSKNLFLLFEKVPDVEHLQFLLDVAIGSGFDIWAVSNYMESFSYLNVVTEYVIQKRYELVMTLLRFGLQLVEEPIYWMQAIYMGLWGSNCDFTADKEFQEMLELLFMVHQFDYPAPGMIQENLKNFYQDFRTTEGLDVLRGRNLLYELIEGYERCGLGFH